MSCLFTSFSEMFITFITFFFVLLTAGLCLGSSGWWLAFCFSSFSEWLGTSQPTMAVYASFKTFFSFLHDTKFLLYILLFLLPPQVIGLHVAKVSYLVREGIGMTDEYLSVQVVA